MRKRQTTTYPAKGKLLGNVGGIVIKEFKYGSFRLYFLTDGFTLRYMDEEQLKDLLLRFVRMPDKKHQQETIDEIRRILLTIGMRGFRRYERGSLRARVEK